MATGQPFPSGLSKQSGRAVYHTCPWRLLISDVPLARGSTTAQAWPAGGKGVLGTIGNPTAGQLREQVRAAVIAASDSGYARARAVGDGMAAALDEAGLGEFMYRVTGFMTGSAGCSGSGWVMRAGPCCSSSISTVPCVVTWVPPHLTAPVGRCPAVPPERTAHETPQQGRLLRRRRRHPDLRHQREPRHHPALSGCRRAQVPVLPPGTDGGSNRRCPSDDLRHSGDSHDHRSAGRRSRVRSCARLGHSRWIHLPRPVRRPRSDQG